MVDERILVLLETLGTDAINAFYVYLALSYGTIWVILGLGVWGVITGWKHIKHTLD